MKKFLCGTVIGFVVGFVTAIVAAVVTGYIDTSDDLDEMDDGEVEDEDTAVEGGVEDLEFIDDDLDNCTEF